MHDEEHTPNDDYFSSECANEHRNMFSRRSARKKSSTSVPSARCALSPPRPPNVGVSWERHRSSIADGLEPLRGIGEKCFYRAVAAKKLVLRVAATLDSEKVGDVLEGATLTVLEERMIEGTNDLRVRVGKDTSPRGLGGFDIGWVTAIKDGQATMAPLHGAGVILSVRNDSLASRIAARRRDRRQGHQGARSRSQRHEPADVSPSDKATATVDAPLPVAETHEKKKKEYVFVMKTTHDLQGLIDGLLAQASTLDSQSFVTTTSKLGKAIKESGKSVDELMVEWDRNHDGAISKQEFRLNVRKMGLPEADIATNPRTLTASTTRWTSERKGRST